MSAIENERDKVLQEALQRVETQGLRDVTLASRGVLLEGNNATKTDGVDGWNADVYSQQNSAGSAYASATAPANNKEVVFGLNEDPTTGRSIDTIDYGWHLHRNGTISIIENGQMINFSGGAVASTVGGTQTDTGTGGSAGGSAGGSTGGSTPVYPYGDIPAVGRLTFQDEFDAFNSEAWNLAVWYETATSTPNWDVNNGRLRLWPTAEFEKRTIDTDFKFYQKYGYFEASMKLCRGKGTWPAFWLYQHIDDNTGSHRPEIDMMEAYPGGGPGSGWGDANLNPIDFGATLHKANADYSYHEVPFAIKLSDVKPGGMRLDTDFHVYGVMWTADYIQFYFDGQPLGPRHTNDYWHWDMYILFDLWFGSASGDPDASTPLGQGNAFEVEYCRAWELADGSSTVRTNLPMPAAAAPTSTSSTAAPALDYYGDSFIYGYDPATGGRLGTPLPAYVDSRTSNLTIANYGVNGNTTVKALAGTDGMNPDWAAQMKKTSAKYVVIALLYNDTAVTTVTQYKDNLKKMFDAAVAAGKTVFFQTCHKVDPTVNDVTAYVQAMRDEASALGVTLFDVFAHTSTAFTGAIRDWVPDGYHPNQKATSLIGEFIANKVVSYIPNVTITGAPGTGGGSGTTTAPASTYPQSGKVAMWGDHITYGLDYNYNETINPKPYITFDNDLSSFTASNEGVTDNTTTRMLNGTDTVHAQLDTWLAANKVEYMTINLTLYESYMDGGISVAQYETNLNTIVDKVRAAGTVPIFELLHETNIESSVSPYRDKMKAVAAAKNVPLIDQYTYMQDYRIKNNLQLADLYPDGRTPNQTAYDLRAHYAAKRFKEIIGAA